MTDVHTKLDSLSQELLDVRRSLGWMDMVISNMAKAVCVVDEFGGIFYANDAYSQLAGQARIFLLGKNVFDVLPLSSPSGTLAELLKTDMSLLKDDSRLSGIYESRTDIDAVEPVIYKLASHYVKTLKQTVIILEDVTKQYELDVMRREFINLASHQLRTPLTAFKINAYMLQDGFAGTLTPPQLEMAKTMVKHAEHMNDMINTLMTIAKMEKGEVEYDERPVDLDAIISDVASELQPELKRKKLSLKISKPKASLTVCADAGMVQDVFSNILSNAVHYTPDAGRINVRISDNGTEVVALVKDTGIGMPAGTDDRIFRQFFRADNALLAYPAGVGLGLYMVKLLMSRIGGRVWFTSAEDKGTSFWVALPK